jgi:hypothetical protein
MKKLHIQTVEADALEEHLRVFAHIVDEEGAKTRAELPQRELATLLPRYTLLGEGKAVSPELLQAIQSTLTRLLTGRRVRLWEYDGRQYFGFLSWRSVRAQKELEEAVAPGVHEDRESS